MPFSIPLIVGGLVVIGLLYVGYENGLQKGDIEALQVAHDLKNRTLAAQAEEAERTKVELAAATEEAGKAEGAQQEARVREAQWREAVQAAVAAEREADAAHRRAEAAGHDARRWRTAAEAAIREKSETPEQSECRLSCIVPEVEG